MKITSLARFAEKVAFYSPQILTISSCIGIISGTVMACEATVKAKEVLDNRQKTDYLSDTVIEVVKCYGPAMIVTSISIAGIFKSQSILNKRNLAMIAAYKALDKDYSHYKNKMRDLLGKEVEKKLRYDIEDETVEVVDNDGKKIKKKVPVAQNDVNDYSIHARFFCESCMEWTDDPEKNLEFLRKTQKNATELLRKQGYLLLNDVYDMLDIPRTDIGYKVGWLMGLGDDYVDFGMYELYRHGSNTRFINGLEPVILLDFNIDGYILDQL